MSHRQVVVTVTFIITVGFCFVIWLGITTIDNNSRYHADRLVDCIANSRNEVAALMCRGEKGP